LTSAGGVLVFENSDQSNVKLTLDITGSSNLRIENGDTFLKKTVEIKGSGG
jgi:hypothetical protein